jgi:hypothetical protein
MLAISRILIVLLLGVLFFICGLCSAAEFQPNDASLKQYKCPEWFRDIKFGRRLFQWIAIGKRWACMSQANRTTSITNNYNSKRKGVS